MYVDRYAVFRYVTCLTFLVGILIQHICARDITFKHLTPDDGLSHVSVNTLYCDSRGFIWIGTREGLNCYNHNGIDVFKWDKNDSTSLFYNAVQQIAGDECGNLYLLCSKGIARYDGEEDRFDILYQGSASAICYQDGLFIARGNAVYRCNTESGNLTLFYELPDNRKISEITWIFRDSQRTWWIGTDAGLYGLTEDGKVIHPFAGSRVTNIYEDSHRNLWVGTWNRGCYFRPVDGSWRNFRSGTSGLLSDFVRCFAEDAQGTVWIGTFLGLNSIDPGQETFQSYTADGTPESLSHNSIWTMICDKQGTVWIGTYYGGVNYFNPEYEIFTHYKPADRASDGLSSPIIGEIVEDDSHNLWICTEGGGLNFLDRRTGEIRNYRHSEYENSLSHDNVKSVCCDPKRNAVWIGTHLGGLNRLDLDTGHFTHYRSRPGDPTSIPSDIVRDIVMYGDQLIVATQDGVCEFDPKSGKARPMFREFPDGDLIRPASFLLVDRAGTLWISVTGKGLYAYRPDVGRLTNYRHDPNVPHSLSCDNINNIRLDREGTLWIATSGAGLDRYRYETDDFENIDSRHHGLSSDCVYDIQDAGRWIFVITNDGLSRFDRSADSVQCNNYNLTNGFPLNGNTICRTDDGTLFIGGTQGMISFDPEKLDVVPKSYEIIFKQLTVNGQPVRVGDESGILDRSLAYCDRITLGPQYAVFGIEIATSNFVAFDEDNLVYRLEGFSDTWIPMRGQHEIVWSNLNPGFYTLVVRSMDGRTDVPEARLDIRILPPFYRTTVAWLFYLFAAVTLLYFLVRIHHKHVRLQESLRYERQHIRDVEELNQSKLRFFTNISHEFRTPLTLILGHAEMLLSNHSMAPSLYRKVLHIYRNSMQLKELIGELLDFRKQEQGLMRIHVCEQDFVAFLDENYLLFEEAASRKQIRLTFEHPEGPLMVWFDKPQMQKVVNNLLSNAFKHTEPGGAITLWIRRSGENFEFGVSDTGDGIAPGDQPRIFDCFYQGGNADQTLAGTGVGLALTKGIVLLHHGTIRVESEPGLGSSFIVTLPLGREAFDDSEIAVGTEVETETALALPEDALRAENSIPEEDEQERAIRHRIKGARMLIVEDNESLRNMLVQLCEPLYEVSEASDGEEGWKKVLAENPQIVLSDVVMPRMSGTELCRRIKTDINTCHIPVVLLTARTALEHNLEGLRNGADDYVTKPFNAVLLLSRCNNLVNGRILMQERFNRQPEQSALMLATNACDKELIDRATTIIREHMDDPEFNVTRFSREMGMARTNLFKKIKAITGCTPNDFIQTIRLKAAVALLEQSPQLSIAEIADRTGFSSAHYFSKCFKQQFNTSPLGYRKTRRQETA